MDVEERILTCRLIEQMESNSSCAERLGLRNISTYHGIPVDDIDDSKDDDTSLDKYSSLSN